MRKTNLIKCSFLFLLILGFIVFSFKDHVYSKTESNHKEGYESIAIDTSTDRIFAVKEDEKGIDIIDIKTGTVINSILTNKEIEAIALDEQRRILAVAEEEKVIHIISLDTFKTLSSIKTREEAKSIGIDSGLGMLLIADEEDRLTAIDLNTYQKIKEIKISEKPVSIAVDSQLHIAVIVHNTWGEGNKDGERGEKGEEGEKDKDRDRDRDNITIIDLQTLSTIKTLQAGKRPIGIAINPATHEAAIANEKSNDITIIDLNTLTIKGTIPLDKHPKALAYNTCLNTLIAAGGEDKAWMQVIDMNTWVKKAAYKFEAEIYDIKVHPYLNKAAIAGEKGLNIISLPNPVPQLLSVTPEKALRSGKSFTAILTGTRLLKTTEVYLNGNKASSTFIQCGTIEVQVPEEYLKNTGDIEIKAVNPIPEGGISNLLYLKVENPIPQISAIDPLETKTNVNNLTLTIYGAGFFEDTEIYFGNMKKPATYVSPTKLQINLTHEDLKTAGEYEIKAFNQPPGGGSSNKAILTIKPSLEIKITSPLDGETINKSKAIVRGTFQSDTRDVGITVNGVIADVTGYEWIANTIPLSIGANTITATIKDSEGKTETSSITINTTDITQHVELSANITSGIPPLQIFFSTSTSAFTPASYQIDFEGDGVIDYTGATFEDINHIYTSESIYYPTVTIIDDHGNTYSDTIAITVINKAEIDALLKGKWEGMKGELKNKDIDGAMGYFVERSKERYRSVFEALKNQLPSILATFIEFNIVDVYENLAEYEIVANENGVLYSYPGILMKDANGIWKFKDF